jgi:Spy/CpxP family protein refolding chaperone
MLSKTRIAGLITGLTLLSMPLVYADQGTDGGQTPPVHEGHWQHHPDGMRMEAKILGLSEDQTKQLKALHKSDREAMKATFKQIKDNRDAFNAEIAKATPDMAKVTDLQNQLKTIQGQIADNQLNSLLTIKKVLTPEQFAGYIALKKERELKMMHKMHGKFGHEQGKDHQWGDKDKDQVGAPADEDKD